MSSSCKRTACARKRALRITGWVLWEMDRVGQNHVYTVFIRYVWQGNHQIYGHIRCIYTVLANPRNGGLGCGAAANVHYSMPQQEGLVDYWCMLVEN
jgi:hypothetical protein